MDEMELKLQELKEKIEVIKWKLQTLQEEEYSTRKEMNKQRLEVYWEKHPDERLDVGMKWLVTEEYVEWYNRLMEPNVSVAEPGDVWTIAEIELEGGIPSRVASEEAHAPVPIDLARRMRQAWLDQQVSTEKED